MPELETISRALGVVSTARDRLERETADLTTRVERELLALDDAIASVRAERERVDRAVEDERARLERLASSVGRAAGEIEALVREAERTRRRMAGQERVLEAIAQDLAHARAALDEAKAERERLVRRSRVQRRVLGEQLEAARQEIARQTAARAESEAALAAVGPPPEAPPSPAEVELEWRLAGDGSRIARAELEHRRRLEERAAWLESLGAIVARARVGLDGARFRYGSIERALEEETERGQRSVAEAEAGSVRGAALVRELETARVGEEARLRELGVRLEALEREAAELREREAAERQDLTEEPHLRQLMTDRAALDLALASAYDERETLERLIGRMRSAAALS